MEGGRRRILSAKAVIYPFVSWTSFGATHSELGDRGPVLYKAWRAPQTVVVELRLVLLRIDPAPCFNRRLF